MQVQHVLPASQKHYNSRVLTAPLRIPAVIVHLQAINSSSNNHNPPPSSQQQTCPDGSKIDASATCPSTTPPGPQTQTCPDGSTIDASATCPPAQQQQQPDQSQQQQSPDQS